MNIVLLNPNTSVAMTEHIVREAGRHGWPGASLVPVTARFGGEVIASRASYAIAAHAALDAYASHVGSAAERGEHGTGRAGAFAGSVGGLDAIVLACFGDPGLEALRELAGVPVVGLLEASVAEAARAGGPFGIVTAGPAWVPMLDERIRSGPHAALSRGVFAIQTTGLDVTRDPGGFVEVLQEAADAATAAGADTVILGGSALAGFGPRLSGKTRLIDPLETAMAEVRRCLDAGGGPGCLVGADDSATGPKVSIAYRGVSLELQAVLA